MRLLGYLVLGCIVLAALKAAMIVLLIAIALTLLIGFVTRPAATLTCLVGFTFLSMANAHPLAGLVVVGLLLVAGLTIRTPD